MPFTTHHAAVLVCSIAVAVAASPLLFGSRPSLVIEQSSDANGRASADQSISGGPSGTPTAPSGSAKLHVQHAEQLMSDLGILFVLDPNFFLCWESILIDETTEGLLAWISSLKDVFTRSSESPTGLDLEVRHKALLDLCHAKTVHSAMTAIQKSHRKHERSPYCPIHTLHIFM